MSRWQRREEALWRETADRVIAMPPGSDHPVALTGTGVAVWAMLAQPVEHTALVGALARRYADPEGRLASDVEELLEGLLRLGLVRGGVR